MGDQESTKPPPSGRTYDWLLPPLVLVAANLIPLWGVFFWRWNAADVVILYWAENVVAGVYGVAKALVVAKRDIITGVWWVLLFAYTFTAHLLVFGWAVLLVFGRAKVFAAHPELADVSVFECLHRLKEVLPSALPVAVTGLIISHGVSFYCNFLGHGEYVDVAHGDMLLAPYLRLIPLHFTVFIGGLFALNPAGKQLGVALLVILKIVLDLMAHRTEHERLAREALAKKKPPAKKRKARPRRQGKAAAPRGAGDAGKVS